MEDRAIATASAVWPKGAPRAGQTASRSRRVRAEDTELFSRISGDRDPIHDDEPVAAASKLGEIVVRGGITTAILNAVVAEDLAGFGTVFLRTDLRFRVPVRPGDVITGSVEGLEVRTDKPIPRMSAAAEGHVLCYTLPLPAVA